jgi:hypothetical protein
MVVFHLWRPISDPDTGTDEAQTANIGFCVIWAEHWKSNLHIANQLFVQADESRMAF